MEPEKGAGGFRKIKKGEVITTELIMRNGNEELVEKGGSARNFRHSGKTTELGFAEPSYHADPEGNHGAREWAGDGRVQSAWRWCRATAHAEGSASCLLW